MKYRKKGIRKPKDFNLNCMTVECDTQDDGVISYMEIGVYINGSFTELKDLKKFHAALGKALEWASIEKDKSK